jgi:hypothetical protein
MWQQILSETIRVIGPMGDCGTGHQRAKINHVGQIGSSRYAFREAFCADLYNWKRN